MFESPYPVRLFSSLSSSQNINLYWCSKAAQNDPHASSTCGHFYKSSGLLLGWYHIMQSLLNALGIMVETRQSTERGGNM